MDGAKLGITRLDGAMTPEDMARALVLYDRSQQRQSVLVRSATAANLALILFAAASLGVAAYQAAKRPVEAFVVLSDALGRFPEVRPLGGQFSPSSAMVADRLRQWIVNIRRRPSDMVVLRGQWVEVMAMTTASAARELQSYVLGNQILAAENTTKVVAEFTSAQQLSDGSWLVRWRETVWQHDVPTGPTEWSALVRVTVRPGKSAADIATNPLGIYVTEFQWSPEGKVQ